MAAATDEAQLKQAFAAELHSIKSDLQALKSKFYDRQAARSKLHDAQAVLQGLGPAVDTSNPFETGTLQELQQLVAAELLDPACTLPIPADALHKKVSSCYEIQHSLDSTYAVSRKQQLCLLCLYPCSLVWLLPVSAMYTACCNTRSCSSIGCNAAATYHTVVLNILCTATLTANVLPNTPPCRLDCCRC